MQQQLDRHGLLGLQRRGDEGHIRAGEVAAAEPAEPGGQVKQVPGSAATMPGGSAGTVATCPRAGYLRASRWRLLAGGELGPDRGHVLIKLSYRGNAVIGDSVQGRLTDMTGQAESCGGQPNRSFSHITTIPDNK